jgi:uncharacterized protein (TIGR02118 family)
MLKFTFLIHRIAGMSREEFINYHRNKHAPLFMSIPEVEKYVRRYVVSHPVEEAQYDAVTDIYFDSMEDYHAFFSSENYKTKVHPDEKYFFKLDEVVSLVCKETIIK